MLDLIFWIVSILLAIAVSLATYIMLTNTRRHWDNRHVMREMWNNASKRVNGWLREQAAPTEKE